MVKVKVNVVVMAMVVVHALLSILCTFMATVIDCNKETFLRRLSDGTDIHECAKRRRRNHVCASCASIKISVATFF